MHWVHIASLVIKAPPFLKPRPPQNRWEAPQPSKWAKMELDFWEGFPWDPEELATGLGNPKWDFWRGFPRGPRKASNRGLENQRNHISRISGDGLPGETVLKLNLLLWMMVHRIELMNCWSKFQSCRNNSRSSVFREILDIKRPCWQVMNWLKAIS